MASPHVPLATFTHPLCTARRFVGPRQYAPKGFREGAARAPMTHEFGEECNGLAKAAYQSKNYGDAIDLFDRALAVRRERFGPIHAACAAVLHNIGRVFLDMKEYGGAENALTEAAAIYEQVDGPRSLKYAESLALLALAYTNLQFLDEAEKAFKDSIRVFRDVCYNHGKNSWIPDEPAPTQDPQTTPLASAAHALADCASLFLLRNQEHQAMVFVEEALEIRRYLYSRFPKYRPMVAQTLNKLCELKKANNDSTGAQMCIDECLVICTETLGRDHPATAQATSSKAGLVAGRKQYREAMRLYEESSTTYALALGKESHQFGQELVKLGRMQELCNEFDLAEKTYRRGLGIIGTAFGLDSEPVAEASTFLAALLIKKLELDQAVGLLRDAIRIYKSIPGDVPKLAYLYQKMAEAYAMKREVHAEAYFLLAIEGFKANAQVEQLQLTYMTDVLDDLGLFYLDFKHYEKAEKCFKEALDKRIELLGDHHATVAYSYSNFALLHLQRQEYGECENMCHASLNLYHKTVKSNVVAQADVYTTLGQCLHQQKRSEEALNFLEKSLNIRRTRGEATEAGVAENLNHIARVYISMNKYAKALHNLLEAKRIVSQYNTELTSMLRDELYKTEEMLPPVEEWAESERAAAATKIQSSGLESRAAEVFAAQLKRQGKPLVTGHSTSASSESCAA